MTTLRSAVRRSLSALGSPPSNVRILVTLRAMVKKTPPPLPDSTLSSIAESPLLISHFNRPSSPDSLAADSQLHDYMTKHFSPSHAKELEQMCNEFVEKLYKNKLTPIEDLSSMVQDFYADIADKASKLRPTTSEFCSHEFLERVETFVCVTAYGILFCTQPVEESLDIALQERIRSLRWVTQGFLETPLDFSSETVEDLLNDAITEIADMNSYKEIRKKFNCLTRCAGKISQAIRVSTNKDASADEFLPVLIYVFIKANPALMHSNLNFIQRFALPSRTSFGESGYLYINMCGAVRFIEGMNANSLRMSKEIFTDFMERFTTRKGVSYY